MTKPTAYSTDKNGITWLPVSAIRTDAGTQHRPALDEKAVEDYTQQMRAKEWNWRRSPIRITKEGDLHWMIGGFHRLAAAERADLKLVGCVVQPGTRRDAILASFSENSHHGVRLDNASKRNKVLTLLADEEWRAWSSHSIAKRCGVSHTFVEKLRVTVNADSDSTERTYVTKQGGVSKMETANIGRRSEKPVDSEPDDQPAGESPKSADSPKTLADLDPTKWYPVNNLGKKVAFDPFDSYSTAALAEQYDITWRPMIADQLQRYPQQFGEYTVVLALPKRAPKPKAAATPAAAQPSPAPAPARAYPMGVHGNVQEDKYYPVMMPINRVIDEPFEDRDSCLHSPKYPGYRPIYGQTLNHAFFFNKFSLAAPLIVSNDKTPAAPDIVSNDVTPAASPACRMIYETNDRFGDYVGSFEEQFLLDADYWGETARADELPTSTEPTRFQFDPERFYPVDDEHKHIYHDGRLAAETIHTPYRGVIGHDLNHAPDFEGYRLLDADLPAQIESSVPTPAGQKSDLPETVQPAEPPSRATSKCQRCGKQVETTVKDFKANMWLCQECFDAAHPGWPTRPAPAQAPEEQPVKPNHPSLQNDKFYITDKRGSGKIITQPYDTFQEAHRHLVSPYDQRIESGKTLNTLVRYERWILVAPANGNGNGNGAAKPSGTPFIDRSNNGKDKDTPRSGFEALGVANAQAALEMWTKALDLRDLADDPRIGLDEETFKRIAKPFRECVIECLCLATSKIDRKAFGTALGTYATAVSEQPVKIAL